MNPSFRFDATPLALSGDRVKAQFHCHTTNSDGGLSVEETIRTYRSKGFRCLGITDHGQVTDLSTLSDDNFISINSTENGGNPDIIGVGVSAAVPKELPLRERARRLASQGGFTIAAHPTWCGALPDAYADSPDLMALEICNAYCDQAYANGLATEIWDMLLGMGKRLWGVAADDAHLNTQKRYYSDAGLGWVEIWTPELSSEAVLGSLKRGAFFSTQGPVFESITVGETSIDIRCSPVAEVRWRTFGRVGFVDYPTEGSSLTGSALPEWFMSSIFVRIELVGLDGKKAWSNPLFVSPIVSAPNEETEVADGSRPQQNPGDST